MDGSKRAEKAIDIVKSIMQPGGKMTLLTAVGNHEQLPTISLESGEIEIPLEAKEEAVKSTALALDSVQRALDGKPPRRVIVVPGRIVNVVA